MYNAQSLLCTNNPAISSTYGIKCTSIFNELKYFNVYEGLPHDLSHDYFEGVIHETLSLVLTRLISEKLFTLDILNNYIDNFKYSSLDINKPIYLFFIKQKIRIKQTQSQTWCLLRILPLMIGHLVPHDNKA